MDTALSPDERATLLLTQMTLEEKIGAVIFPGASGEFTNLDSDAFQQIKDNIQKYHVGGYHIQADNAEGLRLGKRVAEHFWPRTKAYFDGTAELAK